jgi:hypothetical protein
MIRKISELGVRLEKINNSIEDLLKETQYLNYYDLSGLECDVKDPNELMLREEYRTILDHLERAYSTIQYLGGSIKTEGVLRKQRNGRYSLNGTELSCGYKLEALVYDDFDERYQWVAGRIEHNGTDYYIVGLSEVDLEGLKVRVRGKEPEHMQDRTEWDEYER